MTRDARKIFYPLLTSGLAAIAFVLAVFGIAVVITLGGCKAVPPGEPNTLIARDATGQERFRSNTEPNNRVGVSIDGEYPETWTAGGPTPQSATRVGNIVRIGSPNSSAMLVDDRGQVNVDAQSEVSATDLQVLTTMEPITRPDGTIELAVVSRQFSAATFNVGNAAVQTAIGDAQIRPLAEVATTLYQTDLAKYTQYIDAIKAGNAALGAAVDAAVKAAALAATGGTSTIIEALP